MNNILIFGGTFDPIHNGHLAVANAVQKEFNFSKFIFLPCQLPVLKTKPQATINQRLKMLSLAIQEYPDKNFSIDTRELKRSSPSYMITTLQSFRQQVGLNVSITLLIGYDAFVQLPQWHDWTNLLNLTNILVVNRAAEQQEKLGIQLSDLLNQHESLIPSMLQKKTHGIILRWDAGSYPISSTLIRQNKDTSLKNWLPQSVKNYIQTERLYIE